MRNACIVDVLVGARDRSRSSSDVAKRLFEDLPGCRTLSTSSIGPRLSITLLLPEIKGGYRDLAELRGFIEMGLSGKGVALASVHGIREATPGEILQRTLQGVYPRPPR